MQVVARPAVRAVPRVRQEWSLYRAWGVLPRESGWWARIVAWLLGDWQVLLYIGITSRAAVARWAEHLDGKRWAGDIVCWERDRQVFACEAAVRSAERDAIVRERPVHNIEHNGNNPGRAVLRRRLPRHVVARRRRWVRWVVVWLVVWLLLVWRGAGVWSGRELVTTAAVGASLVLVGARVGRALVSRPRRRGRGRRR